MNSIASPLNYEKLLDTALRSAVIMALKQIAHSGFPGNHHFYISFRTQFPGVTIPEWLKERYPDEMTIVLQHQFSDLVVTDSGFSVKLSFNNLPQILKIPVAAFTSFSDPEAPFALQFDTPDWSEAPSEVKSIAVDNSRAAGSLEARVARSEDGDDIRLIPLVFPRNKNPAAPVKPDSPSAHHPVGAEPSSDDKDRTRPEGGATVVAIDQFRRK
ncbi:MAG: ClpXP protease specificity-enhancing factor SspB [Alphaproteobacteria bacterium]|nr:ClpXP protease specificity-enhancing factor SspB [Alphaproteobacteria bacterium]